MSDIELRPLPTRRARITHAVARLEALKETLGHDVTVVLSRRKGRPGYANWIQNTAADFPYSLRDVEFDAPAGPARLWMPSDAEHPTEWSRWWDLLAVAGGAFSEDENGGRQQILNEFARRYLGETAAAETRIDNTIDKVIGILLDADPTAAAMPGEVGEPSAPDDEATSTNDRMLLLFARRQEEVEKWPATRFAAELQCDDSTIRKTQAWKKLRSRQRGARNERRT